MTMPQDVLGVDVAKDWIDVFHLSANKAERVATTKRELARFAKAAKGCFVVLESSGGYERPVIEALAQAGVPFARVNPGRARAFARATGRLAKTDRVDAEGLARMGQALQLVPTPPLDKDRARLAELVARRDDLVATIGRKRNRAGQASDPWIGQQIRTLLRVLERHLATLEAEVAALVDGCETLARDSRRLRSMPGLGPVLAAALIARLPELGQLDRRQIASLAGLAPHACDSGQHRGKRRIQGGRPDVRRALYLAAFIASRHDPTFRAFRTRLQTAGKPTKLALTATARKLLTTLNAMMRDSQDYQPTPN